MAVARVFLGRCDEPPLGTSSFFRVRRKVARLPSYATPRRAVRPFPSSSGGSLDDRETRRRACAIWLKVAACATWKLCLTRTVSTPTRRNCFLRVSYPVGTRTRRSYRTRSCWVRARRDRLIIRATRRRARIARVHRASNARTLQIQARRCSFSLRFFFLQRPSLLLALDSTSSPSPQSSASTTRRTAHTHT